MSAMVSRSSSAPAPPLPSLERENAWIYFHISNTNTIYAHSRHRLSTCFAHQGSMEQLAPAALRAVQTLDFLAAHPSEVFTLSELAATAWATCDEAALLK